MKYKNRIEYLEKKYSETNIAKGEILQPETIRRINKNWYDNQQRRKVDVILNNVKNKDSIKEEVHQIIVEVPSLKYLCQNCKEELIISVIILYVQKTRNKDYRIDRSALWNKYNITWRKYSLIIEKLLSVTRKNRFLK